MSSGCVGCREVGGITLFQGYYFAKPGLMSCQRVAPLWPLKHFVAVNPFLGFTGQSFAATAATFERVVRTRILMPRAFYRGALDEGRIDDAALRQALELYPETGLDLDRLKQTLRSEAGSTPPPAVVATVAEVLDRLAAGDRYVSWSRS